MRVKVEINTISHESWTGKNGQLAKALRIHCVDKTPGPRRFQGPLVFGPDKSQEDIFARLAEDQRVEIDITGLRTLGTMTYFEGFIDPLTIPGPEQGREAKPPRG
jgi:hypothetical protein